MKTSSLYFRAEEAVFAAIPAESRALIERHDELHREWRQAGFPTPTPPALVAARDVIRRDAQAEIAMELRRLGNDAAYAEWDARQNSTPAAAQAA